MAVRVHRYVDLILLMRKYGVYFHALRWKSLFPPPPPRPGPRHCFSAANVHLLELAMPRVCMLWMLAGEPHQLFPPQPGRWQPRSGRAPSDAACLWSRISACSFLESVLILKITSLCLPQKANKLQLQKYMYLWFSPLIVPTRIFSFLAIFFPAGYFSYLSV